MTLVVHHTKILVTHTDDQTVTFNMYPSATCIKTVPDGTPIPEDGTDPTLTDPSLILDEEYRNAADWPLETLRAKKLKQHTQDADAYIEAHYDSGAKHNFQAIYSYLTRKQVKGTITPDELTQADGIELILGWIQAVMSYYYTVKAQLISASDSVTLSTITWDFSQFDASDPMIKLEDFYA